MKFKSIRFSVLLYFVSLSLSLAPLSVSPVLEAQEKEKLKDIKITGNVRVEEDGIRLHLKQRPGDVFDPTLVEQDVKAIFRMGFFDDVQAELSPDGVLVYTVKEKPYIR
jgi:outer membrane protein insertion porin family